MTYYTVKDMPEDERPRERLQRHGPEALSTPELLAIILRTGVGGINVLTLATQLLTEYKSLSALARADFAQLTQTHGLGPAKAAQLMAALELGRRLMRETPQEPLQIRTPGDAAHYLMPSMSFYEQEHFVVLYLNTRSHVIDQEDLYRGGLNTAIVRVAEVFRGAIRRNCNAILVAHNHPSGDPTPSPDDIALTRKLVEAGKLIEIELLDHLVIGQNRFVSLRERGLGF